MATQCGVAIETTFPAVALLLAAYMFASKDGVFATQCGVANETTFTIGMLALLLTA